MNTVIGMIFCTIQALAAGHTHEHPAVHGMLVLGEEKIYLSHLPMFHHPHDKQVIFAVELDPATKAKLEAAKAKSPETVYTLVPEPFPLGEMITKPHAFKAQLFQGHFERGGTVIAEEVTVSKVEVIFQQKLSAGTPAPDVISYFYFGENGAGYLAHVIHGKPDFDQLVQVAGDGPSGVLTFPLQAPNLPVKAKQVLRDSRGGIWKVKQEIYLEFGDLEM